MSFAEGRLGLIILKVAARCNLNCTYCYEFNLADNTWKERPALMSEEVFEDVLERTRRHCIFSSQEAVTFSFHGGEPCLIGPQRFDRWCERARRVLQGLDVRFILQTNGTLLNDEWIDVLLKQNASVGISLDGPKETNDAFRIDHQGRGSYDDVLRGINLLLEGGVPFGILTVIPLGAEPLAIHRHFLSLGCQSLSYLMPDYTHDTIAPFRDRYGPTPCSDFLIPIFDDWWFNSTIDVRIRNFWDISRSILGGDSCIDALGNRPLNFVIVNSKGEIEGLDVLKACENGLTNTGLNVHDADFRDIAKVSMLHARMVFGGTPLPQGCHTCPESDTCGGGYHPHRYSRERGFDNPSVWCADLLALFGHIRSRLGVPLLETALRRDALNRGPALVQIAP